MRNVVTVSSKSQITIPAWACRQLELKPGAKIRIRLEAGRLVLEPVPRAVEELEGLLRGVYGDPDAYVDGLREDRTP